MATTYSGIDNYPTSFEEPDDNDQRDAASFGVGLEALADRTTYLRRRGIVAVETLAFDDEVSILAENFTTAIFADSASLVLDVENIEVGDFLCIDFCVHTLMNGAADPNNYGKIRIKATSDWGGDNIGETVIGNICYVSDHIGGVTGQAQTHTMVSTFAATAAGTTRINVECKITTTGVGLQLTLGPFASMRATVWRPQMTFA